MSVTAVEKLQGKGWYLSNHGYDLVSDYGNITDLQQLIKRAIDFDLKEIGSGNGNINEGNIVLQIQKIRNVAAPKSHEESRAVPRMLKLSLTDGKNSYQAVEVEHIPSLSLNTLPGTKLLLKSGSIPMSHGMILLKPAQIGQILGGNVTNLVEKWELNKKLAHHSRIRSVEEGGPPPWIPFGKKIVKVVDQTSNFKALGDKEKTSKENSEFEAQRKDAIAEAAKQGNKKIFGGGNKQLLDHSVQKIVDQGFSIEQAEYALKINRNNVDRALKSLQKNENKQNNSREPREPKGKRFEKKADESGKPSSGKVSLFDFLEDKLPSQPESSDGNNTRRTNGFVMKDRPESESERLQSKSAEYVQSNKGGRTQKGTGGRNHQNTPKHAEDDRTKWTNYNPSNTQYTVYSANNNLQQNKPPRFQRNNEPQNYYQQDSTFAGTFNAPQPNEYKNSIPQARSDVNNSRNYGNVTFSRSQTGNNTRNSTPGEFAVRNKNYESSHRQNRSQDVNQKSVVSNVPEKSYRNQQQKYFGDDNYNRGIQFNSNQSGVENQFGNRNTNAMAGGPWVWRKGDKCMAKYWEDNMYYNAEVFGVSETTCVVRFNDFYNFEEVLQEDCIPITEEDQQSNPVYVQDNKRQDHRLSNRTPRHDPTHNQFNAGMEFRKGSGGGPGSKNYNKRRNQQRSAQPIYQPPAQRNIVQHTSSNTIHS